jgi:antitoxin (DNA-binding transcriptional repressor) of toxin-antitoxin stability system
MPVALATMVSVNIGEARDKLSQLLAAVEQGETVRICRDGVPVAELRAVSRLVNPLHSELAPVCVVHDHAALQRAFDSDVDWGGASWGL